MELTDIISTIRSYTHKEINDIKIHIYPPYHYKIDVRVEGRRNWIKTGLKNSIEECLTSLKFQLG